MAPSRARVGSVAPPGGKRRADARPRPSAAACAGDYLARGWSVLPVRARDKRPLIRWEALQSARPSAADVADWYLRWSDANVGIVTGEISNLVVIDVDPKHGGEESLDSLQRRFGALPRTIQAMTGGGGRHFYFTHPGTPVRNRVGLAPGIDLRADGGYVVAPPSMHPSGRRYAWAPGCSPADVPLAASPRWLFRATGIRLGRSLADWRALVREGVPEGERNATIASLTGHLLWHGVDPDMALELLLAWNRMRCRPPLDDSEVARAVESIVRTHDRKEPIHAPAAAKPDTPESRSDDRRRR